MKVEAYLVGLLTADYQTIKAYFTDTAVPFLEKLFQTIETDGVIALKATAEQALTDVVLDVGMLATPGGLTAAVASAIPQAQALLKSATTAIENVSESDLITAVHAAAVNLQATVMAGTAPAAP